MRPALLLAFLAITIPAPAQFTLPFCFVGLLSMLATPVYMGLARDIGSDMTGHRRRRI